MSYENIKSISFKNNEVKITSYSNNITPVRFETWVSSNLTETLQKKGKDETIKEILRIFWGSSFQGNSTKYGKFINIYRNNNKKYSWDNVGKLEEVGKDGISYSNDELKNDLYLKFQEYESLKSKKEKFLVKLNYRFIYRLKRSKAFLTHLENEAQKFTSTQIESIKVRFSSAIIEIINLK